MSVRFWIERGPAAHVLSRIGSIQSCIPDVPSNNVALTPGQRCRCLYELTCSSQSLQPSTPADTTVQIETSALQLNSILYLSGSTLPEPLSKSSARFFRHLFSADVGSTVNQHSFYVSFWLGSPYPFWLRGLRWGGGGGMHEWFGQWCPLTAPDQVWQESSPTFNKDSGQHGNILAVFLSHVLFSLAHSILFRLFCVVGYLNLTIYALIYLIYAFSPTCRDPQLSNGGKLFV